MAAHVLKDVMESSEGDRVNFKIWYRQKWTMAAISRSSLSQFGRDSDTPLVQVFEQERERIAQAALICLAKKPTLEPVLVDLKAV